MCVLVIVDPMPHSCKPQKGENKNHVLLNIKYIAASCKHEQYLVERRQHIKNQPLITLQQDAQLHSCKTYTKHCGAEHGLERFLNGRYSYMKHELVHQCITTFLQNQNSRNQLDYQTKNANNQISGKKLFTY